MHMPATPGCSEHHLKLATTLSDAKRRHCSLAVCWVDLANAYGNVHHSLILYSLKHYHAPSKLISQVKAFYTAQVSAASWTTPIDVPPDQSKSRTELASKFEDMLAKVDACPLTRKQKLLLYRSGVCPRLMWRLSVEKFPISWVRKGLDSLASRSWSGRL